MPWLFLLLALAALAVAFRPPRWPCSLFCLLVALVLFVAWVHGAARRPRRQPQPRRELMLDPEELRRLREQAEARKLAAAAQNDRDALSRPSRCRWHRPGTSDALP